MMSSQNIKVTVCDFVRILKTVNRFATDIVVQIKGDLIFCTMIKTDGSAIVHVESKMENVATDCIMNLQDVNRLVSVLTGVPKGTPINMKLTSNAILHNAGGYKFKFTTLDDGIIPLPKVTPDQIKSMRCDHYVTIESDVLSKILKSSAFISSEKVKAYFEIDDGDLMCMLTDKCIPNADEFSVRLSQGIGDVDIGSGYICDIDYLRSITYTKNSVIQIGFGVNCMQFEIAHDNGVSIYQFEMLIE